MGNHFYPMAICIKNHISNMKSIRNLWLLFFILVTISNTAWGQTSNPLQIHRKNIFSIEVLGHGFIYSINYERILLQKNRFITTGQIGLSYYPKNSGIIPIWVPITLNQLFRVKQNHFAEIGFGKLLGDDFIQYDPTVPVDQYLLDDWVFKLGYRFQSDSSRWVFKLAYTPIFMDKTDYIHWGGLGVGFRF